MKKCLVFMLVIMHLFLVCSCKNDMATFSDVDASNDKDIVILITGSTHGAVNANINYEKIGKYKNDLKKENYAVLVDAGDFTSFDDNGNIESGSSEETELNKKREEEIKNAQSNIKKASYDFVAIGENEINIGINNIISLSKDIKDRIHCANLIDLRTNDKVFNSYKIMTFGNKKVAFISALTPDIYQKNTFLFRDDEARYIYDLLSDKNGEKLCREIQNTVKEVKEKGANYIVLVGHFGTIPFSKVCDYKTILENTNGIDVFIDGHSTQNNIQFLKNSEGKEVLFMQVENELKSIGRVYITKDGKKNGQCIDSIK